MKFCNHLPNLHKKTYFFLSISYILNVKNVDVQYDKIKILHLKTLSAVKIRQKIFVFTSQSTIGISKEENFID